MAPLDRLVSEVFAVAKRDLAPGDTLDAIGGTTYYSLIDTYETAEAEGLLPIGLAKGARLVRPVPMDTPITCADVEIASRPPSIACASSRSSGSRAPSASPTCWRPWTSSGPTERRHHDTDIHDRHRQEERTRWQERPWA